MPDVFRKKYRPLDETEQRQLDRIKDDAQNMHDFLDTLGGGREVALAKTKLEEMVMWAVKAITG